MNLSRWKRALFAVFLIPLTISLSGCAVPAILTAITNVLSGIGSVFAGITAVTQGAQAVGDALSGSDDKKPETTDNASATTKTNTVETNAADEPTTSKKAQTKSSSGQSTSSGLKLCSKCKINKTINSWGECDECSGTVLCSKCRTNRTMSGSGICNDCAEAEKTGLLDYQKAAVSMNNLKGKLSTEEFDALNQAYAEFSQTKDKAAWDAALAKAQAQAAARTPDP